MRARILVLYHTSWMEMMIASWRQFRDVEIAEIPLPVVDWDKNPSLKGRIAKLIVDYAAVWKPSFILDVNGSGVLPMPDDPHYTAEVANVPWVEWWFDDPASYAAAHETGGTLDA